MEANIEVEDFETVGSLAWRVLVAANKARKLRSIKSLSDLENCEGHQRDPSPISQIPLL